MEGWVIDLVFQFLPVDDLLTCALVNKEFCNYARRPGLWNMHKNWVLQEMPRLGEWLNVKEDTREVFLHFLSGKLSKNLLFCWIEYIFGNEFVVELEELRAPDCYVFLIIRVWIENNQRKKICFNIDIETNHVELYDLVWFFIKFIKNDPKWRPTVNLYKGRVIEYMGF